MIGTSDQSCWHWLAKVGKLHFLLLVLLVLLLLLLGLAANPEQTLDKP